MAVESSLGSGRADNETPRNFIDDTVDALKSRIAEYRVAGLDPSYMEERLTRIQNAKKGRRKSAEAQADRDDADECVVDTQEKERLAREAGKSKSHKQRAGVPDQKSEKSSDPEREAGPKSDVPDQVSPWPDLPPEKAVAQPPQPGEDVGAKAPEADKVAPPIDPARGVPVTKEEKATEAGADGSKVNADTGKAADAPKKPAPPVPPPKK